MKTGKNIRQRKDGRWEARYIKGRDPNGKIIYGYAYGKTYEEADGKREWFLTMCNQQTPLLMNLLIAGAGSHGKETFEIAENMRCFNKISFVDDNTEIKGVIGDCSDLSLYRNEYPIAFPAVGDKDLRRKWMVRLTTAGYIIPTLIDPSAVLSRNCTIGYGTVICSKAVINHGARVGCGCIVSSGSIIAREAWMRDYSFINSGQTLLENGEIVM